MASIALLENERATASPFADALFHARDTVRIKPYDGYPPRLHAGENGIVRRVLRLYDYIEHEHSYDYWVEIGPDSWLYSESALEVAPL